MADTSASRLSTVPLCTYSSKARAIAAEHDLYASVMIAQAILESASGNSTLARSPHNNLFGIKGSYEGLSANMVTVEYDAAGMMYRTTADFRSYPSVRASLEDYAELLTEGMGTFYWGAWKSNAQTYAEAAAWLQGRYATDVAYAAKVCDLIEAYDLTRFDAPLEYELLDSYEVAVPLDAEELFELDALLAAHEDGAAFSTEELAQLGSLVGVQMADEDRVRALTGASDAATAQNEAQARLTAQRLAALSEAQEGQALLRSSAASASSALPSTVARIEQRDLVDLVAKATAHLGEPYVWGGTEPGSFDCSGLVQYCYRVALGVDIPRTTYYQCMQGEDVDFADLHMGDLVFFADAEGVVGHVGMYLGEGCYIEAPHTGDVVKVTSLEEKMPTFAKRIAPTVPTDPDARAAALAARGIWPAKRHPLAVREVLHPRALVLLQELPSAIAVRMTADGDLD